MIWAIVVGYLVMAVYTHRYVMEWSNAWCSDGTRRTGDAFWFPMTMGGLVALVSAPVVGPALVVWNYLLRPIKRRLDRAFPGGLGVGRYVNAFYLVDRDKRKQLLQKERV